MISKLAKGKIVMIRAVSNKNQFLVTKKYTDRTETLDYYFLKSVESRHNEEDQWKPQNGLRCLVTFK